jgi:trans-L-3-hydroxyproline dehydratase
MQIESIIGSVFSGSIKESVNYEGYDAVIPNVSGTAFITGENTFMFDPDDALTGGFILR